MRQAPELPPGSIEKLQRALKAARNPSQLERVLCLWLRASLRLNSRQVATAIGWSQIAVQRFQARYLHEGEAVLEGPEPSGRRHRYLTREAEEDLLRRLQAGTESRVLDREAIQLAYEQAAGRPVPSIAVYRMLARHGLAQVYGRKRRSDA